MLLHYSWLTDYNVFGNDDEIGRVTDIFFDEERWTVRYLVLKTGRTLFSERVYISPASIEKINHNENIIRTNLSSDDVQKAPDPGEEAVNRKFEKDFSLHYRMNPYWVGNGIWGTTMSPRDMMGEEALAIQPEEGDQRHYVHQAKHVTGYELSVEDDAFGKVDDFLIDPSSFRIKYVVADTKKWLPGGKKVLLAPDWIESVYWESARIIINVTREQVEEAPEYLPDLDLTDEREKRLWLHYGKQ